MIIAYLVNFLIIGLAVGFGFFIGSRCSAPVMKDEPAPVPEQKPAVSESPPEHSCLVKGVLKSMMENAEEWRAHHDTSANANSMYFKHEPTGTKGHLCHHLGSVGGNCIAWFSGTVETAQLADSEARAVWYACCRVIDAEAARARAQAAEDAQPRIAHFQNLGCSEPKQS